MNSHNEPIAIACAGDNNYAMPLAVTVSSLLANFGSDQRLSLFLIDGGIEPANQKKIIQSLDGNKIDITWIKSSDISTKILPEQLPLSDKWPLTTYYRLLLPQIIPQHFHKVIYLDTDLVIQGDISNLWNAAIDDNYALAVQDVCQPYVAMTSHLNPEKFGIPQNSKYFNSGVLVMNLEQWRRDQITDKLFELIARHKDTLLFPDQDALNIVLAQRWRELPPSWNQMHGIYAFSNWQESPYSQMEYDKAIQEPDIIHFTTLPKPWMNNCIHPQKDLFYQYLDRTAWAGWRNTIWRRLGRKITKKIN
jgi:lipopolysaccharide biosynthesis glycosyltransferase